MESERGHREQRERGENLWIGKRGEVREMPNKGKRDVGRTWLGKERGKACRRDGMVKREAEERERGREEDMA